MLCCRNGFGIHVVDPSSFPLQLYVPTVENAGAESDSDDDAFLIQCSSQPVVCGACQQTSAGHGPTASSSLFRCSYCEVGASVVVNRPLGPINPATTNHEKSRADNDFRSHCLARSTVHNFAAGVPPWLCTRARRPHRREAVQVVGVPILRRNGAFATGTEVCIRAFRHAPAGPRFLCQHFLFDTPPTNVP
jgi:hypothetical protein